MQRLLETLRSTPKARLLAATAAALLLALATSVAAFAQTPAPAATVPDKGERQVRVEQAKAQRGRWVEWRLRIQYRIEQRVANHQARLLKQAQDSLPRAEERLAQAKAAGKDVGQLEKALSAFRAAVDKAGGYLKTTQDLLAQHAGFDAEGNVTNVQEARKTVQEAGRAEREFHKALRPAWQDLRDALREFREANLTGD